MKIICFHPALAPYRVDFFNLLGTVVDLKLLLLQDNLITQKFDQVALKRRLRCEHDVMTSGFSVKGRCIRIGLLKIIRNEHPDVVLGYESSPVTLMLIMFRKLRLIKADVWTFMDDSSAQVKSRKGLRKVIRDFVIRNTSRIIVPSADAASAYQSPINIRIDVVPIIHDTETIRANANKVYEIGRAWRRENVPDEWNKVLLFVGRMTAIKNIHWLLDRLVELPTDVGLVLVGDGDETQLLKEKVAAKGLTSRVIFVGRKEGDDLYAMMAMADGLVLCSHSETFGAVVAEALQWGTPCVVAKHLGASVLIEDGKNGVLFKYNDSDDFYAAVAHLPPRIGGALLSYDLGAAVRDLVSSR